MWRSQPLGASHAASGPLHHSGSTVTQLISRRGGAGRKQAKKAATANSTGEMVNEHKTRVFLFIPPPPPPSLSLSIYIHDLLRKLPFTDKPFEKSTPRSCFSVAALFVHISTHFNALGITISQFSQQDRNPKKTYGLDFQIFDTQIETLIF